MSNVAYSLQPIDSEDTREATPIQPRYTIGTLAVLSLLTLFAFWGVEQGEFLNLDDDEYVTENRFVSTGLTVANIKWAFTNAHSGHWHPLTWISHMIDCEIFGLNPAGPHLVNLAFHLATVLMVFLFLRASTTRVWESFFVAALLAISPLRLESVAWIAERKDVLSMFFLALTLWSYERYSRRSAVSWYTCTLLLYSFGLLCKPTLVSVPLLLLLMDYWPLNRATSSRRSEYARLAYEKIPFVILAVAVSILAIWGQEVGGGLKSLSTAPTGERVATAAVGYIVYLGKLFWPMNLAVFYPLRPLPSGLAAGAFVTLGMVTVWALRSRDRRPYLLVGWLWFLIALLPVIGLVQIGGQQVADRWTYLPHIGLLLAAVWYFRDLCDDLHRSTSGALFGAFALCLCLVQTRIHLPEWRSSEALFNRALAVAPDNFFAHTNVGVAYDRQNKLDRAAFHYSEAVRLNPGYPTALNNLGSLRARQGQMQSAIELFERALATSPDFLPARYHLGLAREMKGEHIAAATDWVYILRRDSSYERARASLQFVVSQSLSTDCETLRSRPTTIQSESVTTLEEQLAGWIATGLDADLKVKLLAFAACFGERAKAS